MELNQFLESGSIVSIAGDKIIVGYGKRIRLDKPQEGADACFYFPDFFLEDKKPWFVHEKMQAMPIADLIERLACVTVRELPEKLWALEGTQDFMRHFQHLKCLFSRKVISKAVPYIFETAPYKKSNETLAAQLLSLLRHAENAPVFAYGFWGREGGILGGTPELLFQLCYEEGGYKLQTVACAGTCAEEDVSAFRESEKLKIEHEIVVEGIRQSLSRYGQTEISACSATKFHRMYHLLTPIKLRLQECPPLEDIIRSLHPTPALGVFPKAEGVQWLKDYQQSVPRGRFGAPVGVKLPDRFISYVGIRNAQWEMGKMRIGAGCGIVCDSILENEWEEIKMKLRSIKDLLCL